VYVLDILGRPDREFLAAQDRTFLLGGLLQYMSMDVTDVQRVDEVISQIADKHGRLDGLIAAAYIQRIGQGMRTTFYVPSIVLQPVVDKC
jgi:NAD(P)-dependent dehydrogenase (short-subunit alcohol dehydrogenase family)